MSITEQLSQILDQYYDPQKNLKNIEEKNVDFADNKTLKKINSLKRFFRAQPGQQQIFENLLLFYLFDDNFLFLTDSFFFPDKVCILHFQIRNNSFCRLNLLHWRFIFSGIHLL